MIDTYFCLSEHVSFFKGREEERMTCCFPSLLVYTLLSPLYNGIARGKGKNGGSGAKTSR